MLVFHQWWLLFNNGDKDSYNHPLLCDYMLRFHSFETPSSRRYISHHSSCGTMTYMQLMVSDMFLSHTHRYKLLLFGDEISKMTAAVWLINARFQCFLFSHNQTTFNYLVMPVFRLSHYNIAIIPHPHLSVLQSLFGHLCCCCFFLLSVLLTQQPPCPPGAAAVSSAWPHNDFNHPISHWGTQKHCGVGLGSIHSPHNQSRMRGSTELEIEVAPRQSDSQKSAKH